MRPSGPITTPEPLRLRPKVSAERAPSVAVTCTPTTASSARVSASMAAWLGATGELAARAAKGGTQVIKNINSQVSSERRMTGSGRLWGKPQRNKDAPEPDPAQVAGGIHCDGSNPPAVRRAAALSPDAS